MEGIDYDEAVRNPAMVVNGRSYAGLLEEIDARARELVSRSFGSSIEEAVSGWQDAGDICPEIKSTLEYGHQVAQELQRNEEISTLLEG